MLDPAERGLREVSLPSGAPYFVHNSESAYFNKKSREYQDNNKFTNTSDIQDLDRILMFELLIYRLSTWMATGVDYDEELVDIKTQAATIDKLAMRVIAIKAGLGLDKASRDSIKSQSDMAALWAQLRKRALAFGVMRNEQAVKSIECMMEVVAKLTLHYNCNDEERKDQHCTADEILAQIQEEIVPGFLEIDSKFRETNQKYWTQEQP